MRTTDQKLIRKLLKSDRVEPDQVEELIREQERLEEEAGEAQSLATLVVRFGILTTEEARELLEEVEEEEEGEKGPGADSDDQKEGHGEDDGSTGERPEPIPGFYTERLLSKTGTGAVYQVQNQQNNRYLLRVLFPDKTDHPETENRFIEEGELLSDLDHANILDCLDTGKRGRFLYHLLEHRPGSNLEEVLDNGTVVPEETAFDLVYQLTQALTYLEDQRITHRDVRPGQIWITKNGFAKLRDLGMIERTATDQYREDKFGRHRGDIFSLGLTFYEMVTGALPYDDVEHRKEITDEPGREAVSPSSRNGRLSVETEAIISKMLSTRRGVRYAKPRELLRDLERVRWEKEPHALEDLGETLRCELCETENVITRTVCETCGEPLEAPGSEDFELEALE